MLDPTPHSSSRRHAPPRLKAARRAIGALFFVNGLAFATWVSRIPAVQRTLDLSPGALGGALAGLGAGSLVAMPIAGWLIARYGSRPVTMITALACGATLVLPALAWNALTLAIALGVFGAAMGSMDVSMNAQGVELEHQYDRPVMATFHALFSLGGMTGAALGGAIAALGVGTAPHFMTGTLLVVAAAAATLPALVPAPPPSADGHAGRLRLSAPLLGLSALAICILMSEGAMADWTSVYLSDTLHATPGLAASGYAVFSLAMTIGRLTGDALTLRVGRVRLVRTGASLAAVGLAGALLVGTVPAALVGFLCVGAGLSVIIPLVFAAAGRLDGSSAGPGLAAVTTAGYLGFLAGPPLIGLLAERSTLPAALATVVLLMVAGAVLARSVALRSTA